jgi:hypothetical protein
MWRISPAFILKENSRDVGCGHSSGGTGLRVAMIDLAHLGSLILSKPSEF